MSINNSIGGVGGIENIRGIGYGSDISNDSDDSNDMLNHKQSQDKGSFKLTKKRIELLNSINSSRLSDNELTLKGFLEIMDGVYDSPGRIVTMSTNHPEKLDPAILRHGRISMRIHLTRMKLQQLIDMIQSYYGETLT
jgi:mitochondrial chaperone BCS1